MNGNSAASFWAQEPLKPYVHKATQFKWKLRFEIFRDIPIVLLLLFPKQEEFLLGLHL